MKKSSTPEFMKSINFVPSICIHRSIILVFIAKKSMLFDFFPTIFHFHFRENPYRLVGLVVRCPPQKRKIQGLNPAWAGFFRGRVIPVTLKLALQWLPCQAPGVIGSALGLVGPVSVYCDWVRRKVGSATSISA